MPRKPSVDPDAGLRRFLEDLRSSYDRRTWEERRRAARRAFMTAVSSDRRADNGDRRGRPERRDPTDRRRRISETFSEPETVRIREMLFDDTVNAACPRCDGNLLLGPSIIRGGDPTREVHCTRCRYGVILTTPPE